MSISAGAAGRAPSPRGTAPSHPAGMGRLPRSSSFDKGVLPGTGHDNEDRVVRRVRLGICAMSKKARSKPMTQILSRLPSSEFEIVIFGDDLIKERAIEEWPIVDCLIAFFSKGFPLAKAEAYVMLRKPFCINDLSFEHVLRDRRLFYAHLEHNGIAVPPHLILARDGPREPRVVEHEDALEVDGDVIFKPFVEKPVDAEDHNIHIYYPRRMGGGCKRLFRKVDNKSSEFLPDMNRIRRKGSFIYEEFLLTSGTDIKVYAVGPDYAHAEARKSPVVDGIVQRDADGKELRFPIMLTPYEKELARRVVLAFRQNVCGFDLLRTHNRSYICDVNGWSFVKKSIKYYDDAAHLLTVMMLRARAPHRLRARAFHAFSPPAGLPMAMNRAIFAVGPPSAGHAPPSSAQTLTQSASAPESTSVRLSASAATSVAASPPSAVTLGAAASVPSVSESLEAVPGRTGVDAHPTTAEMESAANLAVAAGNAVSGSKEELRCVLAVIRHGDRTPKQKLKMTVSHPRFLSLHRRFAPAPRDEAKLKSVRQLQLVLQTVRDLLTAAEAQAAAKPGSETEAELEDRDKLTQIRAVLEHGGRFHGINRKVQLKPTKWTPAVRIAAPPATPAAGLPSLLAPIMDVAEGSAPNDVEHEEGPANEAAADLIRDAIASPTLPLGAESSGSVALTPNAAQASLSLVGIPVAPADTPRAGDSAPDAADPATGGSTAVAPGSGASVSGSLVFGSIGGSQGSDQPRARRVIGRPPWEASADVDIGDHSEGEGAAGSSWEEDVLEVQLVLKWGGVLTEAGRRQAEELGSRFRNHLFPGESSGLLRLHATYRHDLKIYSSDEGRVQMTAAAFTKAFLALDGELTPILASLVRNANTQALLDDSGIAKPVIERIKAQLRDALLDPANSDSDDEVLEDDEKHPDDASAKPRSRPRGAEGAAADDGEDGNGFDDEYEDDEFGSGSASGSMYSDDAIDPEDADDGVGSSRQSERESASHRSRGREDSSVDARSAVLSDMEVKDDHAGSEQPHDAPARQVSSHAASRRRVRQAQARAVHAITGSTPIASAVSEDRAIRDDELLTPFAGHLDASVVDVDADAGGGQLVMSSPERVHRRASAHGPRDLRTHRMGDSSNSSPRPPHPIRAALASSSGGDRVPQLRKRSGSGGDTDALVQYGATSPGGSVDARAVNREGARRGGVRQNRGRRGHHRGSHHQQRRSQGRGRSAERFPGDSGSSGAAGPWWELDEDWDRGEDSADGGTALDPSESVAGDEASEQDGDVVTSTVPHQMGAQGAMSQSSMAFLAHGLRSAAIASYGMLRGVRDLITGVSGPIDPQGGSGALNPRSNTNFVIEGASIDLGSHDYEVLGEAPDLLGMELELAGDTESAHALGAVNGATPRVEPRSGSSRTRGLSNGTGTGSAGRSTIGAGSGYGAGGAGSGTDKLDDTLPGSQGKRSGGKARHESGSVGITGSGLDGKDSGRDLRLVEAGSSGKIVKAAEGETGESKPAKAAKGGESSSDETDTQMNPPPPRDETILPLRLPRALQSKRRQARRAARLPQPLLQAVAPEAPPSQVAALEALQGAPRRALRRLLAAIKQLTAHLETQLQTLRRQAASSKGGQGGRRGNGDAALGPAGRPRRKSASTTPRLDRPTASGEASTERWPGNALSDAGLLQDASSASSAVQGVPRSAFGTDAVLAASTVILAEPEPPVVNYAQTAPPTPAGAGSGGDLMAAAALAATELARVPGGSGSPPGTRGQSASGGGDSGSASAAVTIPAGAPRMRSVSALRLKGSSSSSSVMDDRISSLLLTLERWRKLGRELYSAKHDTYDLSKLPDVYDCIKHDILHAQLIKEAPRGLVLRIYRLSRAFADIVVPQEYGVTSKDKYSIGASIAYHLLRKIFFDLTAVHSSMPASGLLASLPAGPEELPPDATTVGPAVTKITGAQSSVGPAASVHSMTGTAATAAGLTRPSAILAIAQPVATPSAGRPQELTLSAVAASAAAPAPVSAEPPVPLASEEPSRGLVAAVGSATLLSPVDVVSTSGPTEPVGTAPVSPTLRGSSADAQGVVAPATKTSPGSMQGGKSHAPSSPPLGATAVSSASTASPASTVRAAKANPVTSDLATAHSLVISDDMDLSAPPAVLAEGHRVAEGDSSMAPGATPTAAAAAGGPLSPTSVVAHASAAAVQAAAEAARRAADVARRGPAPLEVRATTSSHAGASAPGGMTPSVASLGLGGPAPGGSAVDSVPSSNPAPPLVATPVISFGSQHQAHPMVVEIHGPRHRSVTLRPRSRSCTGLVEGIGYALSGRVNPVDRRCVFFSGDEDRPRRQFAVLPPGATTTLAGASAAGAAAMHERLRRNPHVGGIAAHYALLHSSHLTSGMQGSRAAIPIGTPIHRPGVQPDAASEAPDRAPRVAGGLAAPTTGTIPLGSLRSVSGVDPYTHPAVRIPIRPVHLAVSTESERGGPTGAQLFPPANFARQVATAALPSPGSLGSAVSLAVEGGLSSSSGGELGTFAGVSSHADRAHAAGGAEVGRSGSNGEAGTSSRHSAVNQPRRSSQSGTAVSADAHSLGVTGSASPELAGRESTPDDTGSIPGARSTAAASVEAAATDGGASSQGAGFVDSLAPPLTAPASMVDAELGAFSQSDRGVQLMGDGVSPSPIHDGSGPNAAAMGMPLRPDAVSVSIVVGGVLDLPGGLVGDDAAAASPALSGAVSGSQGVGHIPGFDWRTGGGLSADGGGSALRPIVHSSSGTALQLMHLDTSEVWAPGNAEPGTMISAQPLPSDPSHGPYLVSGLSTMLRLQETTRRRDMRLREEAEAAAEADAAGDAAEVASRHDDAESAALSASGDGSGLVQHAVAAIDSGSNDSRKEGSALTSASSEPSSEAADSATKGSAVRGSALTVPASPSTSVRTVSGAPANSIGSTAGPDMEKHRSRTGSAADSVAMIAEAHIAARPMNGMGDPTPDSAAGSASAVVPSPGRRLATPSPATGDASRPPSRAIPGDLFGADGGDDIESGDVAMSGSVTLGIEAGSAETHASHGEGRSSTALPGDDKDRRSGPEPAAAVASSAAAAATASGLQDIALDFGEAVHKLDSASMTGAGYVEVKSPQRHVRTRLYFTSESHVHALVNVLRFGPTEDGIPDLLTEAGKQMISSAPELDYCTHIVFRLYERPSEPPESADRHRLEVLFSPGASYDPTTGTPRAPIIGVPPIRPSLEPDAHAALAFTATPLAEPLQRDDGGGFGESTTTGPSAAAGLHRSSTIRIDGTAIGYIPPLPLVPLARHMSLPQLEELLSMSIMRSGPKPDVSERNKPPQPTPMEMASADRLIAAASGVALTGDKFAAATGLPTSPTATPQV